MANAPDGAPSRSRQGASDKATGRRKKRALPYGPCLGGLKCGWTGKWADWCDFSLLLIMAWAERFPAVTP